MFCYTEGRNLWVLHSTCTRIRTSVYTENAVQQIMWYCNCQCDTVELCYFRTKWYYRSYPLYISDTIHSQYSALYQCRSTARILTTLWLASHCVYLYIYVSIYCMCVPAAESCSINSGLSQVKFSVGQCLVVTSGRHDVMSRERGNQEAEVDRRHP